MTRPLAALAVLLAVLVLAAPAGAQVVPGNADSLRQEIVNANNTPAVDENIQVPPGTYNLTSGELVITDGVTLQGEPDNPAVIHQTGPFRVLCIATADDVDLQNLTISGGRASSSGACADSQGGGIRASGGGDLRLSRTLVTGNSANPAIGGGGGIFFTGAGLLELSESVVSNNTATATGIGNNGGGGIYFQGGLGVLTLRQSTISGNRAIVDGGGSGGGGIYTDVTPSLTNVTVSGNSHLRAPGALTGEGGGGILSHGAAAGPIDIQNATFSGNHSDTGGGALAGNVMGINSSILNQNTAPTNATCTPGAASTQNRNVEFPGPTTCGLGGDDKIGQDPQLGPLAANGAENRTFTHALLTRQSAAVDYGDVNNCPSTDERNVSPLNNDCDSGAYEFDGVTRADVPDCSRSGVIPLAMEEPPGNEVLNLLYRMDGGAETQKITGDSGGVGDPPTTTDVTFAEGRHTLEYWGQWDFGVQQGHGFSNILVDQTNPTISVENNQRFPIFVITRRATVDVAAADALSGLVQNPSGDAVRVSTASRGATTFDPAAVDLCQNTATAPFNYRVLAPGLGVRTVLERISGRVRVRGTGGGSGAHASQKGVPFRPLSEPRELPIRSLIDARAGTARLTTARSRRESNIQDGEFSKGIFQVLQSRKTRSRGLTTLALKGGNFSKCLNRAGKAQASGVSRRTIRRLKANAHGRFRTRGRHSAATVRGTIFTVTDRCDGTLTRVKRGRVVVRDFRLHKNVVVRAGKSYFAKARR